MVINYSANHYLCADRRKYKGIDYYVKSIAPKGWLVAIDVNIQKREFINFHWAALLGPTEFDYLLKNDSNFNQSLPHFVGLLCAKLALSYLNSGEINSQTIWKSKKKPNFGQPECPNGYISISHSGKWVVAIAACTPVGVDVQQRCLFGESALSTVFTERETLNFEHKTLTQIWCVKESYLKMSGRGLIPHARGLEVYHLEDNRWLVIEGVGAVTSQNNYHILRSVWIERNEYVLAICLK